MKLVLAILTLSLGQMSHANFSGDRYEVLRELFESADLKLDLSEIVSLEGHDRPYQCRAASKYLGDFDVMLFKFDYLASRPSPAAGPILPATELTYKTTLQIVPTSFFEGYRATGNSPDQQTLIEDQSSKDETEISRSFRQHIQNQDPYGVSISVRKVSTEHGEFLSFRHKVRLSAPNALGLKDITYYGYCY